LTKAGAASLKQIVLMLQHDGTIASGDIWVSIQADSTGDPSGTALATSEVVAASGISDSYEGVTFTFATPLDLADETDYWIVLEGDYTASATNQIQWRAATLEEGGNASIFDSGWSADTTLSFEYSTRQLVFSDVTGGAFTAVGNAASMQQKSVNLDAVGAFLRVVDTVAGGSATGAAGVLLIAM
jgi:hypothetical protein